MKDNILQLIKASPKHAVKMIFNRPDMKAWIMVNCDTICIDNATRIYTALTREPILCPCNSGKLRKLISLNKGLSFCGPAAKCSAAKEAVSRKCIAAAANWDKETARTKRAATNKEKYGVENIGQTSKAKETRKLLYQNREKVDSILNKMQETCMERHGCLNPMQNADIYKKHLTTLFDNYGVEHPINHDTIKDSIQQTNMNIYGVPYGLMSNEVKEKIRKTFFSKYNTYTPLELPEIRDKIKTTIQEKYGQEYSSILQVPLMRATINNTFKEKYGVYSPAQLHFSKAVVGILFDKEKFSEKLTTGSVSDLAKELGISRSLIKAYHDRYELDIVDFKGRSRYEDEIQLFLEENQITFRKNDRKVIAPLELDFYIPDHDLAIEFNGLYWHSEKSGGKDRNYHRNKYVECEKSGVQLLTIFEDEWVKNSSIIKKHIMHLCHKTTLVVGARKIRIASISSKAGMSFLENNHIQGMTNATIFLGGFHDDKLVSVLTLLKTKDNIFDINRFSTDQMASYAGLFSRFLSYIKTNYDFIKTLTTFADCRWSKGNLYFQAGFSETYQLRPEYSYTDYNTRQHKFNYRKKRLKKYFDNAEFLTEKEMTEELGLDKIWDCGKIKFTLSCCGVQP